MLLITPIATSNSSSRIESVVTQPSVITSDTALAAPVYLNGKPDTDATSTKSSSYTAYKKEVEKEVRTYFANAPIMAEIAFCESSFRHLDPQGELVRGKVNSGDVGVMQINERVHKEQAAKLGYDLHTMEGNMAYAKWLYEKQGTTPWNSSWQCWGQYE